MHTTLVLDLEAIRSTLFPYTTLFRSCLVRRRAPRGAARTAPPLDLELRGGNQRRDHRPSGRAFGFRLVVQDQAVGQCGRSEEHTAELQSRFDLVCRLLLEKKNGDSRN